MKKSIRLFSCIVLVILLAQFSLSAQENIQDQKIPAAENQSLTVPVGDTVQVTPHTLVPGTAATGKQAPQQQRHPRLTEPLVPVSEPLNPVREEQEEQ